MTEGGFNLTVIKIVIQSRPIGIMKENCATFQWWNCTVFQFRRFAVIISQFNSNYSEDVFETYNTEGPDWNICQSIVGDEY